MENNPAEISQSFTEPQNQQVHDKLFDCAFLTKAQDSSDQLPDADNANDGSRQVWMDRITASIHSAASSGKSSTELALTNFHHDSMFNTLDDELGPLGWDGKAWKSIRQTLREKGYKAEPYLTYEIRGHDSAYNLSYYFQARLKISW